MSIRVHVRTHGSDTVVALDGAVDADLVVHLGDSIATVAKTTTGRLLLDIDDLTLLDDGGFGELVGQLVAIADGRSGIIARRIRTRQVLDRWGIGHRVPVYDSFPKESTP